MAVLGTVEVESMVLSVDGRHQIQLTFTVPLNQALMAYTLQDVVRQKQGKPLKITISEIKKKRTLSQNAYAWVLMHRLAENQRSTAEEIYQVMLQRYGLHVLVRVEAGQEKAIDLYQVRTVGQTSKDGVDYAICSGIIGSSKYDTAQMARFLDGIVSECNELGIDTEIPDELTI